ncbi:MAG: electron transfer flavoprotein subunit alpha/FixB family protein [Nitrospinota bacterium]|nr:electron transfer flavoprotein subunit alpha/FixB family protein [Nitrospinota bacterium]
MKALLIGESRKGKTLGSTYELAEFAKRMEAQSAMFIVDAEEDLPKYEGKLYLASAADCGELNPPVHAAMAVEAADKENADIVILSHSPYGWDLAPLIARALGAGQVSEVVEYQEGAFITPALNGKMRLFYKPSTARVVVTVQSGAFAPAAPPSGAPTVEKIAAPAAGDGVYEFVEFEEPEETGVALGKAKVVVSAGRGVGKVENIELVKKLAEALDGELGASRPVVDAGWVENGRQVGTSGKTVAPKLYVACGISGAAQHIAGMKGSEFIVAINTDPEAPITEVAHVTAQVDLKQLIPALLEKLKG